MPLLNSANNVYAGSTAVKRVYQGTNLVWPAAPTNFRAAWTSTTTNTLTWTDRAMAGSTYDIYYSGSILADWTTGTKIGTSVAQGVQTLTHTKDAAAQGMSMVYYGIVAKSGANAFQGGMASAPKTRISTEWLPITALANTQAIQLLVHLASTDVSKIVAFSSAGDYSVDWGDGTSATNHASGTVAAHTYTYSGMSNQMADTKRQAMLTITPQAGGTLTGITMSNTGTINPVEATVACSTLASLKLTHSGGPAQSIKSVNFLVPYTGTCRWLFLNMYALTGVYGRLTGSTDFTSAFNSCSLTASGVPDIDTSQGTTFAYMFQYCSNAGLTTIPLLDTSKGTDFNHMFDGCNKMTSVPALNTAAGTNFSAMFSNCSLLATAPITSVANGTSFNSMFAGDAALTTANIPAALTTGGGTANGTDFGYMFNACTNAGFTTIPLMSTGKGTDFSSMFQGASQLTSVPALNVALGTSFGAMFSGCSALAAVGIVGARYSISIATCAAGMPTANINTFYTNLGTAAGAQTVTVAGLTNQAASTKSIATGKGWAVA